MGSRSATVSPAELAYYRAHFREALRADGVVCLECGRIAKLLGTHVVAHDLSLDDYREKWGYNRQTTFTAADTYEKMRGHAVRRRIWELPPPDVLPKAWDARKQLKLSKRLESRVRQSERMRARYATGWQPPRHRKADDETLRGLVAQGLTARQIAQRTGLTVGALHKRFQALGLSPVVPDQRKASDEQLLDLRRAGLTMKDVAARLGLSPSRVNARLGRLRRSGVAVPSPPARPHSSPRVPDMQLLLLGREGLSGAAIAARVGIAPSAVGRRLAGFRRRGLLPPPVRPGPPPVDERRVLALARKGLRTGQIAARLQMPRYRIYETVRRLRERGLVAPHGVPQQARHDPRILELNRAALWPSEIAARLGLTARYVNSRLSLLRRQGVAVHRPRGAQPLRRPRVSNDEILALARAGLRPSQIAARVGMKPNAVGARLRLLRQRGRLLTARWDPHAKRKPYTDEQVLALARGGLRSGQIAGQLGISQITAGRRLRALREQGLLPSRRAGELSERDRQILELRRAGLWPQEIAAHLGIPASIIRPRLSKLRARGIAVPTPSRPRPNARRRAATPVAAPPETGAPV